MAAIATAFVSVRPDLRNFKSDADREIRKSGLDKSGEREGKLFGLAFTKGANSGTGGIGKGLTGLTGSVSGFGDVAGAASGKSSLFQRALAGVGAATGVLEPVLAGAIVAAGGLAAAFAAAGAGAIAYQVALKPLLSQTSTVIKAQTTLDKARATAQAAYTTAIKAGVSVQTATAARTKAMATAQNAYNIAVKGTPPAVRAFATEVSAAKKTYTNWADSLAVPVLAPLSAALKLLRPALHAISPLVTEASSAFHQLVNELASKVSAGGLTNVVNTLLPHVRQTILDLGHSIGNVAAGIFDVLKAFLPVSGKITGGVLKLTKLFKDWAASLPTHTGFQSLMATFKTQSPQAIAVLKNLALIIKNVAAATVGLASPANSKALLNILIPLTSIVAKLSQNQALVRWVLYILAFRSALKQLSPAFTAVSAGIDGLRGGASAFRALSAGFSNSAAAASASTGAWGTLGGKLGDLWQAFTKTALAQKVMTAGAWLLDAAMNANVISVIVLALAALGIAFYLAWTKSATFRKIVIGAFNAVLGIAKGVWSWIKDHWPLLVGILGGPIGIAAVLIIKNWRNIWSVMQAIFNAIKVAWRVVASFFVDRWNAAFASLRGILNNIGKVFKLTWDYVKLGALGAVKSVLDAFSHIPIIGHYFKTAANQVGQWIGNIQGNINSLNGRTVSIGANFKANAFGSTNHPFGKLATGGVVRGPGGPTDDRVPILASNDEFMMSAAAHKKYGTRFFQALNARKFARGGPIDIKAETHLTNPGSVASSITSAVLTIASSWAKSFGALSGGIGGAGVQRWAPLVLRALSLLGQAASWLPTVLRRMNQESGGNPNAINLTDSNAQAGYPSQGLMQTIPQTFAAYAGPFRGLGITNPFANIFAGLNYALHTYGSLAALNRPGGYANGGLITEPIFGVGRSGRTYTFGEKGPERVTPGMGPAGNSDAAMLAELRRATQLLATVGSQVADALNGATRKASYQSMYSAG